MSRYHIVEVEKPTTASPSAATPAAAWQDWTLPHHCTVSAHRVGCLTFTLVLPADDADQAARAALVVAGEGATVVSVRDVVPPRSRCAPEQVAAPVTDTRLSASAAS